MKKLLTLFLFLITICFASNDLIIYKDGKQIGKMTIDQFKILIQSAESYNEIMEAQNKGRIKIECISEVKEISKNKYEALIKVSWLDETGKECNYITAVMYLSIDEGNTLPEWRIFYDKVAEVGFPLMGCVAGVLALLLFLL